RPRPPGPDLPAAGDARADLRARDAAAEALTRAPGPRRARAASRPARRARARRGRIPRPVVRGREDRLAGPQGGRRPDGLDAGRRSRRLSLVELLAHAG